MVAWWLVGLAVGQEVIDQGPPPVEDVAAKEQQLVAEWEGGACRTAQGGTGHHLYVQASLPEREEQPGEIAAMLGRVTARACGEQGLGYACAPLDPEDAGARSRSFERGQRVNGLLRLPISRWLTTVQVTVQPKQLHLRYTLYAEGPGPGNDGWLYLCQEAQGLVAQATGVPVPQAK